MLRERDSGESRMADICVLEERGQTMDEDADALRVAPARFDESTAEHASLAAGAEQTQAEVYTLLELIAKLEVDAATGGGELGDIF